MGIATYVPVDKFPTVFGNKVISFGTLTLSDSYAGESIDCSGNTVTYVASADTITRTTGSWLDSGIQAGDNITITNSTSNNTTHDVLSVTALVITCGNTISDETNTTLTTEFVVTEGGDYIDWSAVSGMGTVEYVSLDTTIGGFSLASNAAFKRVYAFESGGANNPLVQPTIIDDLSGETAQVMIVGKR